MLVKTNRYMKMHGETIKILLNSLNLKHYIFDTRKTICFLMYILQCVVHFVQMN